MKRGSPQARITFGDALQQLEAVLRGEVRREILDALTSSDDLDAALANLRKGMRSHAFPAASGDIGLRRAVDTLDARTRREGMHVLQGWDFVAHKFPKDIAPVLLVDYCARLGIPATRGRAALAILLDQHFLALLSLLVVRAWDEGDANHNLDRISAALSELQGSGGSGHQFVADAETLLMLAVSYYHPEEQGYDLLVQRVAALDPAHQLRFAGPCAALLGGHLRWGLRFMYERDVGRMRDDNVADYPLLTFAVQTLAGAYDGLHDDGDPAVERASIIEGLLNGLSADPWAFADRFPVRDRQALLADFASYQPSPKAFSPLSFSCNFPTNAMVAMAAIAVNGFDGHPSINALFTRGAEGGLPERSAHRLAEQLMKFAASDPTRLGAGGVPLLVYDPYDGAHCYNALIRTISAAS